jgi:hypothetical protein
MLDIAALRRLREERFFAAWDGCVPSESVEASEQAIRSLLDDLVALGPAASKEEVRHSVHQCVERFNGLDRGWICTIEREDICDCLARIVEHCGMDSSAEWIAENREW